MHERIIGYDVARAVAIFGMMVVNFQLGLGAQHRNVFLIGFAEIWHGKAAATFVTLAGIGVMLMTRKARETQDIQQIRKARMTLFKRGLFLMVAGIIDLQLWIGDILHMYGLFLPLSGIVLLVRRRWLLYLAISCVFMFVVLFSFFDWGSGWNFTTFEYADFWTFRGFFVNSVFNGWNPLFPWMGFMVFGMYLSHVDLTNPIRRRRWFWVAVIIMILTQIASIVLQKFLAHPQFGLQPEEIYALAGTAQMPPLPLYIITGGSMAVIIITGCLYCSERFAHLWIIRALEQTGRLALTIYMAHIVLGLGTYWLWIVIKHGIQKRDDFLKYFGTMSIEMMLVYAVSFYALSVAFSMYWNKRHQQGPLESLMRKLAG